MTLVVSFGVTAGVIAMSANDPPTGYVADPAEELLACEADLGKLRTAKAQIESRALIYLRDLTDARRLQAQCRAEAGHALPMLLTAQATVAAQKLEILRLKSGAGHWFRWRCSQTEAAPALEATRGEGGPEAGFGQV